MVLNRAHNPHVLRVRPGCCALSVSKLAAVIYASWDRFVARYGVCQSPSAGGSRQYTPIHRQPIAVPLARFCVFVAIDFTAQ
ncbi:hypothetical protein B6E78_02035 [Edwardsiella ictaluri]|nr:hypothetical protein B6E78_02035 [Edwardsiella ictaluri]